MEPLILPALAFPLAAHSSELASPLPFHFETLCCFCLLGRMLEAVGLLLEGAFVVLCQCQGVQAHLKDVKPCCLHGAS